MDLKRSWNLLNIYDLMIIALLVITAYNIFSLGMSALPPVIALVLAAVLSDVAINYVREKKLFFPKSALITGLILGVIIEGNLPLLAGIAAIAILSKHFIRIKGRHIFNPAVFGLFIALFLPLSQSWWGTGSLLIGLLGLIIVFKLKRFHLALPFLAVHALIIFTTSLDLSQLGAHIFSGSLLFFAFYMLIEPVTSPASKKSRMIFGLLVGIFAAVLYVVWLPAMLVGALFFADLCVPVLNRMGQAKSKKAQLPPDAPVTNPNW